MNILLQSLTESNILIFGTFAIGISSFAILILIFYNQKKTFEYQKNLQAIEKQQQTLILKASLQAEEMQKTKLAANLHDDAGPLLASIKLFLPKTLINFSTEDQTEIIKNAKDLVDQTSEIIRNISHELSPPTLKRFGLKSAIEDYFEKLNKTGTIKANAAFKNYEVRLNDEDETNAFRLIQELLKNIFTHSNASSILLTQNAEDNYYYFRLEHDGVGLLQEDFVKLSTQSKGLGLKNILARINTLNGEIRFDKNEENKLFRTIILIPQHIEIAPKANTA